MFQLKAQRLSPNIDKWVLLTLDENSILCLKIRHSKQPGILVDQTLGLKSKFYHGQTDNMHQKAPTSSYPHVMMPPSLHMSLPKLACKQITDQFTVYSFWVQATQRHMYIGGWIMAVNITLICCIDVKDPQVSCD